MANKLPLEQQVAALADARMLLERVWQQQAARGGADARSTSVMRDGLAAAAATMIWMRDNEAALRAVASDLVAINADPGVRRLLEAWPGARLAAVRQQERSPTC
jgi:hypothetical protein